ncbi:MAG: excisionase family DNA binding protein [Cryomorphaceae bacterium]
MTIEAHTVKDKKYYTTIETSKLLGVSVRTIQLWVERGALDAWKTAGGHRRIVRQSVDDYIEKQQKSHRPSSERKSILIVEDNPTVAKFYQAAINSWDLDVDLICKQDGFEGLLEIGRSMPDLLITDIYMPGMDGLQMIRSLYKSELISSERMIVISGLSKESIDERGGVPSDIAFFTKPVDMASLKEAILNKLPLWSDEVAKEAS